MEKRHQNEKASRELINPYLVGAEGLDRKGRGGWAKHVPDRAAVMERAIPERMINLKHGKVARMLNSTSQKYSALYPYLDEGDRVLDLCSGSGFGAMLMSRSGYDVTAVDYHTDILEYREGIEVYNVDLLKEDLSPIGQFNAVVMIDCIEHFDLEGQTRIMQQAYEALVFGGTLLIDTPNSAETVMRSRHHLREMTWEDFGTLVDEAGFDVEKRYSITWVADTFAALLETYSEDATDQVIVARKG
jgi:2-polyprenyl-3-methyl-5-hydroxy-6-metoxy-1,4-benzoquinol methylase